jgi:hypothetical protein
VKAGHLSLNLNVLLRQRKDLSRILEERVLLPSFEDIEELLKNTPEGAAEGEAAKGEEEDEEKKGSEKKKEEEKENHQPGQTSGESSKPSSSSPTRSDDQKALLAKSIAAVDSHERDLFESPEMESAMKIKLEKIDDAIRKLVVDEKERRRHWQKKKNSKWIAHFFLSLVNYSFLSSLLLSQVKRQ